MTDFDTLMNSYERHSKALAKANEHNKAVVFDALAASCVTAVTVEFDGEGDSGQIEAVTACAGEIHVILPATRVTLHEASWQKETLTTAEKALSEAIEELCYAYLEQKHGGWEINDGAFGEFTLDVASRTVELEFNGRFSDFHTSTHTF